MSDGPHKSLPMQKAWRKLAQRVANSTFDPVQVAEAIPDALGEDWQHDGCDEVVRELRSALGDTRQQSLFGESVEDKFEALNGISPSGFPLRRLLLECVTQAVEGGLDGAEAIAAGTEQALGERLARGNLQVEEHYRRSQSDQTAAAVRRGLRSAAAEISLKDLAGKFLKIGGSSTPPASRRDGLDDGVPHP